jgi:ectoine hydroxylase-related dioxygenase (phytanoyl-CoA dioxygenase family)
MQPGGAPPGGALELTELERDGFAVVRGLLAPQDIRTLSSAFDRLQARARTLNESGDADGSRFVLDREPFRLHRVVWCGGAEPLIAAYGDDPRFLNLAADALRANEFVQIVQQAHFKLPGDGVRFDFHQDASNRRYGTPLWTDVDGRGSFVQIAVAVDPMGPDNGGLRFLSGSHRLGFVADVETGRIGPEHVADFSCVSPTLEPGDAVAFGPFVVHGSEVNASSSPRRMLLQGYAQAGANRRVYPGCGTGVPRAIPDGPRVSPAPVLVGPSPG